MTRTILGSVASLLLLGSSGAFAAVMNWELTPVLPGHVENPGGTMSANCWVDTQGSTPDFLRVIITDPADVVVFSVDLPGYTEWDIDWVAPAGSEDGVYHYRAEYYSVENGLEAAGGEGFLMAGASTRGICAFKFIDENGNGALDEGELLAEGWEICFTFPDGHQDCDFTDEDGVTCKFFIPPGVYTVCEVMQDGYENTTPLCVEVPVTADIEKAMFGNRESVPGACCFPDGSCIVLSEEDCAAQGGIYYGDGSLCDPNPCVQPTGACCLPDGTCVIVTEEDCAALGGVYYGDGSLCDPNPCDQPTGACCLPDGTCVIVTESSCADQGGIYYGDGSLCDPSPCEGVPTLKRSWGQVKSQYR